MSGIPPANIAAGIVQATVSERQRAEEKNVEDRQKAQQAKEQAKLSDQQEHQVEDTLQADGTRVRRHDEEEARRRRRHRYRPLPEDPQDGDDEETNGGEADPHIDLQA